MHGLNVGSESWACMLRRKQVTNKKPGNPLPRREQEVLDILHTLGKASAAEVQNSLPDQPSYSATRMLLQRLEKKGLAKFETQGARYIYSPALARTQAAKGAWQRIVDIFFAGSSANAFSALFDANADRLSDKELDQLEALVAKAKAQRKEHD